MEVKITEQNEELIMGRSLGVTWWAWESFKASKTSSRKKALDIAIT